MGLYPGAFTHWQGKRCKVLATEPLVRRLIDQLTPEARSSAAAGLPTPTEPPAERLAKLPARCWRWRTVWV